MELKIRNRDYVSDGAGGLVRVSGWDELLERVLFKLSVRRGSFALAPELGSEPADDFAPAGKHSGALHVRATAAKQFVAEALAEETDLTVSDVTLEQKGDLLTLCIALLYEGEEREISVKIGGE